MVISDECSEEEINDLIEEWCEKEGSGLCYGYTWDWEFVTDPSLIGEALTDELSKLNRSMYDLNIKIEKIEKFIEATSKIQ